MRETKLIELAGGVKVEVKASLNWGEKEDLKEVLYKGARIGAGGAVVGFDVSVLTEQKWLAFETLIVEITEADGTKKKFTREWIRNLEIPDGDKLTAEINVLLKPVVEELSKMAAAKTTEAA